MIAIAIVAVASAALACGALWQATRVHKRCDQLLNEAQAAYDRALVLMKGKR